MVQGVSWDKTILPFSYYISAGGGEEFSGEFAIHRLIPRPLPRGKFNLYYSRVANIFLKCWDLLSSMSSLSFSSSVSSTAGGSGRLAIQVS